ncbi:MAG: LPS-assembly protein LptD [Chitinophagaceae bacterium]|nr:MAG: LPS-assembly protein LptD [Chitinophagaceae bacterium]
MSKRGKNSLKYNFLLVFLACLLTITHHAAAHYPSSESFYNTLTLLQDSSLRRDTVPVIKITPANDTIPVRLPGDTTSRRDSLATVNDTFNLKLSKDSLDAPVEYSAMDSMVLDVPTNKIILYSKGNIIYKDMNLTADSIEMDQDSKMVTATFRRDSLGQIVGKPRMKQSESTMDADVIRYNFETQRGITQNTFTQQGEMYVQGERIKKINENELFAYRGIITTCNYDIPHFNFRTKKMKMVNKKLAVTGPVHPEFEGVPVPVYIPFGYFPMSQGRHSGLLPPEFTANEQFGLGLEGLGYYKVINDNLDITFRSNVYSYGGWAAFVTPTYRKRYRYNGSLNLAVQSSRILSYDAKQEFSTTRTYNVTWSHTMDSRARPGTNFSASVNAGSSKFNQFVANNPTRNYSNQMSSSITYSKTWGSLYNLTASANHSQNNIDGRYNINLPTIAFTVNTFYPLQKKEFIGAPKWYEKLGIGLNTNVANQITFFDSSFSLAGLIDTMQWGAQHSIPIQLALPQLGPLQIAPGISFQEKWYSRKFERRWNDALNKVDTIIDKGFYSSRDVSFSLGLSSAIFGLYDRFGPKSSLRAIRHVIRPTFSMSYRPDVARKDFYATQIDTNKNFYRFSYYDGSIFGPVSEGEFGGIGFGLDNNIEIKVRSKSDTTDGGIKKIRLLDGFGFNGSYNFLADSFKLSNITIYLRSTLFEKINITAGATLDPYKINENGFRQKQYAWDGGKFSPGRITSGNIAISTSFQSKAADPEKQKRDAEELKGLNNNLPPVTLDEQYAQMDYIRQNPAEFADFNIPWSVNLSYSLSFTRDFNANYSGFTTRINSNFNFNGDFNLSPKWKLGMNGYYDFRSSQISALTMFLSREMHCWQLSINVTPVGLYRSFNISINPKSGLLRDLKINRSRSFTSF